MALEFSSKKETFPKFRTFETTLAGRPLVVETGKMCGLSNGSAMIRYGETCVLCNVVMSAKPRDGIDFFPLSVEFEEKMYAVGRIPGSFMRREGRPGEKAVLTSRVIDRPIRPLFPHDMRNDVCVTMTVMSLDPDNSAEIAGMIGTSLVLSISDIPWNGPIGGVQVGLVDGQIVLNPTKEQRAVSELAMTVAASQEKIVMIEAGANEVDEQTVLEGIKIAHEEIKKTIAFINSIVAEIGKPKVEFTPVEMDKNMMEQITEKHLAQFEAAMDTDDKNVRDAAVLPIMDEIAAEWPDLTEACGRPRHQRNPSSGCRGWHSASCSWFGHVHPRPDAGADCCGSGQHQGRTDDGRSVRSGLQALYPPLQFPALLCGRGPRTPQPRPPRDRPRRTGRARSDPRAARSY